MKKLLYLVIVTIIAASSCTTAIGSLVGDMTDSPQKPSGSSPSQEATADQAEQGEDDDEKPSQAPPRQSTPDSPAPVQESPQQVTQSPSSTSQGGTGATQTVAGEQLGVLINTNPQGASVFLNRKYLGESPVLFLPENPGSYLITASAEGYRQSEIWVTYKAGSYVQIQMELDLITGYLNIDVTPPGATVTSNGRTLQRGVNELAIGTYNLRIQLFGYQEWTGRAEILDGATTNLSVTMEEAVFNVTPISLSRDSFNPANPGSLGRIAGTFEVTAPGTGEVRVLNFIGDEVQRIPLERFTTWDQRFEWDGITGMGFRAPDGEYTFVLDAAGASGAQIRRSAAVLIDSTKTVSIRGMWNGVGGLLYVPDTTILPSKYFQAAVFAMGHAIPGGGGFRAPIQAGLRVGIPEDIELAAQGTIVATSTDTTPFSIGASLKYGILPAGVVPVVSLAAYAKGTYLNGETYDTQTNFTGFSVGASAGFDAGPLRFLIAPELTASPSGIAYPTDPPPGNGLKLWGYLRTGAFVDTGSVVAGVSGAVRTDSFLDGFSIHYPFSVGAEVHFIVPSTSMVLSVGVASEIDPVEGLYILGGAGISVLN